MSDASKNNDNNKRWDAAGETISAINYAREKLGGSRPVLEGAVSACLTSAVCMAFELVGEDARQDLRDQLEYAIAAATLMAKEVRP